MEARERHKSSVPLTDIDILGILVQLAVEAKSRKRPTVLSERDVSTLLNKIRATPIAPRSTKPFTQIVNSPHARSFYDLLFSKHRTTYPFPLSVFFKEGERKL